MCNLVAKVTNKNIKEDKMKGFFKQSFDFKVNVWFCLDGLYG